MKNLENARILYHLALFEEMQDQHFRARAYDKAARGIESCSIEIKDIYEDGVEALLEIEGISKAISEKIEELLKIGQLRLYEKRKNEFPIEIDGLTSLEGVG